MAYAHSICSGCHSQRSSASMGIMRIEHRTLVALPTFMMTGEGLAAQTHSPMSTLGTCIDATVSLLLKHILSDSSPCELGLRYGRQDVADRWQPTIPTELAPDLTQGPAISK